VLLIPNTTATRAITPPNTRHYLFMFLIILMQIDSMIS